jgi:hypothetical protein
MNWRQYVSDDTRIDIETWALDSNCACAAFLYTNSSLRYPTFFWHGKQEYEIGEDMSSIAMEIVYAYHPMEKEL